MYLLSLIKRFCNGVFVSSVFSTKEATFPNSVFIPVEVTIASA